MQGKNSKPRYVFQVVDPLSRKILSRKKYTSLQDIANDIKIDRKTCLAIMNKKSKYCKVYKIKKIV